MVWYHSGGGGAAGYIPTQVCPGTTVSTGTSGSDGSSDGSVGFNPAGPGAECLRGSRRPFINDAAYVLCLYLGGGAAWDWILTGQC